MLHARAAPMDGPGAAGQRSAHAALPQAPHAAGTFAVVGGEMRCHGGGDVRAASSSKPSIMTAGVDLSRWAG